MRIVIAGGHGKIALLLSCQLADTGHEPVGIIRNADQATDLRSAGAIPLVLDLEHSTIDDVAAALAGADAAIFAAGSGAGGGNDRKFSLDRDGAILLADAALEAGVTRLIVISSVGADSYDAASDDPFQIYLRAKGEADAQRDAKARFVASASHDLGQPLQAARLFFDQAIRSSDPAARTRATASAEAAFDAVERQLQRMNEYLRLEAGAVSARFADVAAGEPIARAAALAEAAAARAGVALHVVSSRLWARADADLIERALSNLIDNALRHAKARRLLIGARSHGPRVRLWVIDDGVGIAVEDRARLFEDYVQGSDHGDETRGGFGLGLASVRRIAALMHGTVGFATNTRRGSAFYLELPRSITQAQRDAIMPDMR